MLIMLITLLKTELIIKKQDYRLLLDITILTIVYTTDSISPNILPISFKPMFQQVFPGLSTINN
jgi:hypothetical protein